jgi:CDP-6-deoxy-D-xylo-4-hexulose-3-dehydrase
MDQFNILGDKMHYPLATTTWTDDEKNAAKAVIDSGMCTMGAKTKQLEEEFAKVVGTKYAVFSNSGSSANLLAISALMYTKERRLLPGDEVIVPAVSWSTTYYPIFQNGLKMKIVDVDYATLNISVSQIETAIGPKTRAIFAVNLLGCPCDFDRLYKICLKHDLILIVDNCESMGATYHNQEAGTFGAMGTYSTFFSHHLCTVEGGFSVTNNEELYQIMLSLRAHGWTRNLPDKNHVHDKDGVPFNDMFRFVLPGYNLRPNEIFAAIGLEQLRKLPDYLKDRRANHLYFMRKLIENKTVGDCIHEQLTDITKCDPSWFGFAMLLHGRMSGKRKEVVEYLLKKGVECRPLVAGNFAKNPVIKWMPHEIVGDLPNAKIIDEDGLFVGNNPGDLKPQIDYLFECLEEVFKTIS